MRRGPWHQCGDKSQRLVGEQLELGTGAGVVLSPRDLSMHASVRYAESYHDLGAHVLMDPQFHVPSFSNRKLATYGMSEYRKPASQLHQMSDLGMAGLAEALHQANADVSADGIIAPAVVCEAGRADIADLNERLFRIAKQVGDAMGVPTYATVIVGRSAVASSQAVTEVLSEATALDADGWYFAFEFDAERVPSTRDAVYLCCRAGLALACTGKPVMHAYAGPMALLSMGFGATACAVGHSQNLWRFTRSRWQPTGGGGGRAGAPPRYFSASLWGTIIYPDEVVQLPPSLGSQILTHSTFSEPVGLSGGLTWSRWDANKHLVNVIGSSVASLAAQGTARDCASAAVGILQQSCSLHSSIADSGLPLADNTSAYQANWMAAVNDLLTTRTDDFDYLDLIG